MIKVPQVEFPESFDIAVWENRLVDLQLVNAKKLPSSWSPRPKTPNNTLKHKILD